MILVINPSLPDITCPHCKTGLDIETTYEEADSEIKGGKVSCPYCDEDFVLEVIPQSYKAVLTDQSGDTISKKTLDMMDSSMKNFKKGKAGPPINQSGAQPGLERSDPCPR